MKILYIPSRDPIRAFPGELKTFRRCTAGAVGDKVLTVMYTQNNMSIFFNIWQLEHEAYDQDGCQCEGRGMNFVSRILHITFRLGPSFIEGTWVVSNKPRKLQKLWRSLIAETMFLYWVLQFPFYLVWNFTVFHNHVNVITLSSLLVSVSWNSPTSTQCI